MPGMFGGGGMSSHDVAALANQEAQLNRSNTYSPIYGGTTWTRGGGGGGGGGGGRYDPNTGQPIDNYGMDIQPWTPASNYDNPGGGGGGGGDGMWTETQTLSPYMQQRFNLVQDLMGRVGREMQPLDTASLTDVSMDPNFEQNQADEAFQYSKGYLDPQWAMQEQQMKGQLAAQGLHPGDPGYNQAMTQFQTGRTKAYDQARSGSYQTGVQAGATRMATRVQSLQAQIAEQLQKSGWSLGQINALMAGLPPPPGGSGPQSNLLGASMQNSQLQQQLAAQGANNLLSSGAIIGAAALSDVNAKEDFTDAAPAIEEFLQSAEPAEYSYKPEFSFAGEGRQVSPMAQNLEQSRIGRSMVVETPVGKVVDYGKSFGALLGSLSHLNKKLNGIMGL